MARLRQVNANRYKTSADIDAEFASVIRYLNAAEIGNKTVSELLIQLFDGDGLVDGIVELRLDSSQGLQFRSGTFANADQGWRNITSLEAIRGEPGISFGQIGDPAIAARADYVASAAQTVFPFAHNAEDAVIAYKNGLLLRPGLSFDYTSDASAGTVTLNSGALIGETVTLYRVREVSSSGFVRSDFAVAAPQSVFAIPSLTQSGSVQVYRNGLLQRPGSGADYTLQADAGTVTFNSPVNAGNLVSTIVIDNGVSRPVAGFMLESNYTDVATGLIRFNKIGIADGAIPQAKVSGLSTLSSLAARMYVQPTTPANPAAGTNALWLNTSTSPNELFVWSGTAWERSLPEAAVPQFSTAEANRYLRVNGPGTGLVWAPLDLSSRVPTVAVGAANGVAALDSEGRLIPSQLPARVATESLFLRLPGAVADATTLIKRVWRQKLTIEGVVASVSSGTCTAQVVVNGVAVGPTFSVSSVQLEQVLGTPIVVDATTSPRAISIQVSGGASPQNLEVTLACAVSAV